VWSARADPARPDTVTNPTVLVGLLSAATRDYDRGEKLIAYQSIATLRDVLLVDQNAIHVERVYRTETGTWLREEMTRLDAVVQLTSLGIELPLAEMHREVFGEPGVAPAGLRHSPHTGPS
jgi:Uma2 family endonuclease